MRDIVIKILSKKSGLSEKEVSEILEVPPNSSLGDYALPCFVLSKKLKKNPAEIANNLAKKMENTLEFEKVEAAGPYVNVFVNGAALADQTLGNILAKKDKYGSSNMGKGKKIILDMSSPNIAKTFGIGHLRSTIIGNSIANISKFQGYGVKKINYFGDWGTQFGRLILGFKKFGSLKELNKNPINYLLQIYIKVSSDVSLDDAARLEFKKLESGDMENLKLWKLFRKLSLGEFNKIYNLLGVKFDATEGESDYNKKMDKTVQELKKKNLLEKSEGAQIVNLESYGLGVCLIKKSDGATLYATRDLTAAIDRHKRYKPNLMFYEVGAEQKLHFRQVFKVLELMGYSWAKNLIHIDHGLYLGEDGKKFSTRKGKTVFMADILNETEELAKAELRKRYKLSNAELNRRALAITRAAIFYGDLKNHRAGDIVYDIDRFISFEGDTGPYLLYSYARARSILSKARYKKMKKIKSPAINNSEKQLIMELSRFSTVSAQAFKDLSPNLLANYAFQLSQNFNEFYHTTQVIGSESEQFRLALVDCFSQVLKNALSLLGISVIEKM